MALHNPAAMHPAASLPAAPVAAGGPWTAALHHGAAAIDALAPAWSDLLRRVPGASAFATPGWARAWWRTYGRHHEAVLLEVRAGGRMVGLLPLQVSHIRGTGVRVLELLGGSPPDWRIWLRNPYGLGLKFINELLVEPGHERGVLDAVRRTLSSGELRWDTMRLTCVPSDNPLTRGFDAVAEGWSARRTPFTRLRIDTDRTWEEYKATLSKRQRRHVRYRPNELSRAADGELRLDVVRGRDALPAVEEFIDIFERRWTARGKPGLLSGEGDLCRHLAEDEPSIVVWRLLGGERVLASQIGFDDGRVYTPYNYAFDPEFSVESPSHLLTHFIIQRCCEDEHTAIEQITVAMGSQWTGEELVSETLEATRPSPLSRTRAAVLHAANGAVAGAQSNAVGRRVRASLARAAATVRRSRRED